MTKKVIILAAGKGARMTSYSKVCPKSLLEFKGEPLLHRQLSSLSEAGIRKFVIVAGYMIDKMREFVDSSAFDITLVYNPFYAEMNSVGSLWFAREYLYDDVFITNGDTYYKSSIPLKLRRDKRSDYVYGVDESRKRHADYRVTFTGGYIIDMGKDISEEETMAEYIGLALIRKRGVTLFRDLLEKVVKNGNYDLWWEDLFLELMAKNRKISCVNVTGETWFEVDEIKDYRRYQRYF